MKLMLSAVMAAPVSVSSSRIFSATLVETPMVVVALAPSEATWVVGDPTICSRRRMGMMLKLNATGSGPKLGADATSL